MKFTIATDVLKRLVVKAEKGASNNKLLPLTGFLGISLKEKTLKLETTDMTNYVSAIEHNVEGEDFEVVVTLDSFSKIVSKTTVDTITLEFDNKSLKFIGNGTYNIELPLNEESELIKFPKYTFIPNGDALTINYDDIRSIINANKSCIATDNSVPALTYYYCGDEVISTNQTNICLNEISLFGEPVLISNRMMDLVSLFGGDTITVELGDNAIRFSNGGYTVYGKLFNNIEDYPAEPIEAYLTAPFAYNCKLNKDALLGAMDRLVIFSDKLDDGHLNLKFEKSKLKISNKANTSFEEIAYLNVIEGEEEINYSCALSYDLFKNQIASNSTDVIDLYFCDENDVCVKIVDNNITKITSLQEA